MSHTGTGVRKNVPATQIIALGFLLLILVGGLLLLMPVCNNKPITMLDAMFTSGSAVCVTGLTTTVLIEQFTMLGQFIILLLVQIGGLGFMVFITLILMILRQENNTTR